MVVILGGSRGSTRCRPARREQAPVEVVSPSPCVLINRTEEASSALPRTLIHHHHIYLFLPSPPPFPPVRCIVLFHCKDFGKEKE